jgi:hypothetical protein
MKLLLCPKLNIVKKRFTYDTFHGASAPRPLKCTTKIPPEVLWQVTISDYLNFQELGRFLLCTCRSFVPNLGSDYVWKFLCQSKWKYTLDMDETLIQAVGYETLFRKLSRRALLQREQDPIRKLAAFFHPTDPTT